MQTLYLVRHAESTLSGRYCGSTDAPLSKRGLGQARTVAEFFKANPFEVCYLSDLLRVRQTARHIRADKKAFIKAPRMREIDFGEWEGLDFKSVSKQWKDVYRRWLKSPSSVDIPSGEPFARFSARIKEFQKELMKSESRNIAVIAHGGSISVLAMLLLKKPASQFWKWTVPPASISVLKRDLARKNAPFKVHKWAN